MAVRHLNIRARKLFVVRDSVAIRYLGERFKSSSPCPIVHRQRFHDNFVSKSILLYKRQETTVQLESYDFVTSPFPSTLQQTHMATHHDIEPPAAASRRQARPAMYAHDAYIGGEPNIRGDWPDAIVPQADYALSQSKPCPPYSACRTKTVGSERVLFADQRPCQCERRSAVARACQRRDKPPTYPANVMLNDGNATRGNETVSATRGKDSLEHQGEKLQLAADKERQRNDSGYEEGKPGQEDSDSEVSVVIEEMPGGWLEIRRGVKQYYYYPIEPKDTSVRARIQIMFKNSYPVQLYRQYKKQRKQRWNEKHTPKPAQERFMNA